MPPDAGRSLSRLGERLPAPPKTLRPDVRWGCKGGGTRQLSRGQGRGHGFCGAAAAAIVPGGSASVTTSRTLGVTDQDLRQSEAWLGNRRHLAGMIRAVVAARRRRPIVAVVAGGSTLLGHGVALEGAWYNERLLEGLIPVVVGGGCMWLWRWYGVSRYSYPLYYKRLKCRWRCRRR